MREDLLFPSAGIEPGKVVELGELNAWGRDWVKVDALAAELRLLSLSKFEPERLDDELADGS